MLDWILASWPQPASCFHFFSYRVYTFLSILFSYRVQTCCLLSSYLLHQFIFAFLICLMYIDSAAPVHFQVSSHSSWRFGSIPVTFTRCTFMSPDRLTPYCLLSEVGPLSFLIAHIIRVDSTDIWSSCHFIPHSLVSLLDCRYEFISLLFHN